MTKLTREETENLFLQEGDDYRTLVEEGDWEQDGKYQYCFFVYNDIRDGKHYRMSISRSGPYNSDWYYSFEYSGAVLEEVEQQQEIRTVWKAIKHG